MFRNYFLRPVSRSPINLAVARILFSVYLIWKIVSVRWQRVEQYPIIRERPTDLVPDVAFAHADIIAWISVGLLLFVAVGVYLRITAYSASVLVCYLGIIHAHFDWSFSTVIFFPACIFLILLALYAEQDEFSIDGLRWRSNDGLESLNNHLKRPAVPHHLATPLVLFLFALGFLYFGAAIGKLINTGPEWVSAANQGRYLDDHLQIGYLPQVHKFVANHDTLLLLGGIGTLIAQLGLLVAIITGWFFGLAILALLVFHVATAVVMGPVFIYTAIFLLLFLDWERLLSHLQSDQELKLFYDEHCLFCAQSLYFFKFLDVDQTMTFYSQSDIPNRHFKHKDIEPANSIYVFQNDSVYEGFYALRVLCRYVGILYPIYLVMLAPGVSKLGEQTYKYITRNHS